MDAWKKTDIEGDGAGAGHPAAVSRANNESIAAQASLIDAFLEGRRRKRRRTEGGDDGSNSLRREAGEGEACRTGGANPPTKWEAMYAAAVRYRDAYGDLDVLQSADREYPTLAQWIHYQRTHYQHYLSGDRYSSMTEAKVERLKKAGLLALIVDERKAPPESVVAGSAGVQRGAARKKKRKNAEAGTPTIEQGGDVAEPPHEEEAKDEPRGGVPVRLAGAKRGAAHKGKRKDATAPAEPAGASGPLVFNPPRSKSSGERKSCICGWGDDCCRLKKFFDGVDHVLSGRTIDVSFSDSCNFQNFWRAACACTVLGVPAETKAAFEKRFREMEGNKVERKKVRFEIARHHFSPEVLSAKLPLLAPITKDTLESLGCYKGMTPSSLEDAVPRYDPELGKGQSQRGRKRCQGRELHVIAPCATLDGVTSIAAMVQTGGDGGRAVDERRTPEEWRALLRNAVVARDAEVGSLREDIARLMGLLMKKDDLLMKKDDELVRKEAALVESRKNVARKRSRLDRMEVSLGEEKKSNEGRLAKGKQLMRRSWRGLLEGSGGVSRLTMFDAAWHEGHPSAARLLWGFKTLEEAKQRVMELFPEVDTNRHPTLRMKENMKGDLTLPPISDFEKCLITRMYCRLESNQGVVSLLVGCHRVRVGQILKEWAPRWAAAGDEHAQLDIKKREKMLGRKRRNEDPDQFEPLDSLLND